MLSTHSAPPFRADQVGSLLRPPHLIEARKRCYKQLMPAEELRTIEDEAIREVVARQEAIGLKSIGDGEFRRQNYILDFFQKAFGAENLRTEPSIFAHRNAKGDRIPINHLAIYGEARWSGPIFAEHFSFLRSITRQTPKITLPSPLILHFFGGDDAVLRSAYASLDTFWADLAEIYRKELEALHAVGCRYVQIDETSLVKFGDPEIRALVESRGDDWKALVASYVEALNAVLMAAPTGMTIGIHVCRGNRRGFWQADAGYEYMADQLFRKLKAEFYFLEFDSPRAGPLDALRAMPDGKKVVLGLVTTKSPDLETRDVLVARILEAAKFMPLERLGLSTQCGFSGNVGNTVMSIEQQFEKLKLVVDTAREVWGEA